MEELSKKALLWQLQDFIMTSSCLKGIFLVSVITKKYPNFLMLPFEKQNHRNLFLCKKDTRFQLSLDQSSMFLNGNNLQVSCWAAFVGFTVVIATIRFELTIGFNPCFFLKENHHRWLIPSFFPSDSSGVNSTNFHEELGFPSIKWNISKTPKKTTNFFHLPRSVLPGPETCMLGLKFTWSDPLGMGFWNFQTLGKSEFTSDFTCTFWVSGFQNSHGFLGPNLGDLKRFEMNNTYQLE